MHQRIILAAGLIVVLMAGCAPKTKITWGNFVYERKGDNEISGLSVKMEGKDHLTVKVEQQKSEEKTLENVSEILKDVRSFMVGGGS